MGEEILLTSERIKQKDSPGKFYKVSTENNKDIILSMKSRRNLDRKYFCWLKYINIGKKLKNRFQRQERYSYKILKIDKKKLKSNR